MVLLVGGEEGVGGESFDVGARTHLVMVGQGTRVSFENRPLRHV